MIIAGADIETTGLEWAEGHRIIEVHVGHWNATSGDKIWGRTWRINPLRSILPAAQAVHHISITDLEDQPHWDLVAKAIYDAFKPASLVVGHNWDAFDGPFLSHEFKRAGLPPLTLPSVDTMVHGRWATPLGMSPSLGALCFACGVEYDPAKAHAADYDVDVMMQCFFRGVVWGWFKLPEKAA